LAQPPNETRRRVRHEAEANRAAERTLAARDESDGREATVLARRGEIIDWSLAILTAVAIGFVLYAARLLLMPIVTAFVIGVMVSPAAGFLERYRVPRPVAAALIVCATAGLVATLIAVISSPLAEWTSRLPDLGPVLKQKLHFFDGPIEYWGRLETMLGVQPDHASASTLPLPSLDWVQTTFAFVSPTLTEFLLFLAVLLLFVASWPDLRRGLVLTFATHESRLTALKIMNEIEARLAGYLATVTSINLGLGVVVAITCAVSSMPNPIGLGVLAATLNFIPIIGPIVMFVALLVVGVVTAPTLSAGLLAAGGFAIIAGIEGHFVTPAIIGRRLSLNGLAVLLSLAFWSWLWGPMGAFLSSPLLIVGLILKEHLVSDDAA
jgi:predicted PurR-regulated permease PerM